MKPGANNPASSMNKGMFYILAGVIAVLVIVVGFEIGIDFSMTTGINLDLSSSTRNAE